MVEELRPYTYRAEHVSGKDNCIADALSRAPVDQPTEEDMLGEEASRGIRQIVRRAASCAGIDDELQETLVDPNMEWYSGWPCVHMWTATPTSRKVINQIKRWFVDWGVPLGVRSDGGPQYDSSEYREFLKAWGVNPPGLSTPTYAQSNGRAEAAVKAMKSLVEKTTVNGDINCDEFQKGLLEWRNTPKEHGKSPAELVFGCQQRSVVPSLQMNMVPKWKANIEKKVAELQRRSERNYNIGAGSLEQLNVGDKVRVQNAVTQKRDDVGEIMRIGNNRDYVVNIPGKKMGWRNRRFIRFVEESGEDDGPLVRDVEYEWLIETQKNTEVNRLSSVSEDDGHSKPRRSGRERKPVIRFSL